MLIVTGWSPGTWAGPLTLAFGIQIWSKYAIFFLSYCRKSSKWLLIFKVASVWGLNLVRSIEFSSEHCQVEKLGWFSIAFAANKIAWWIISYNQIHNIHTCILKLVIATSAVNLFTIWSSQCDCVHPTTEAVVAVCVVDSYWVVGIDQYILTDTDNDSLIMKKWILVAK